MSSLLLIVGVGLVLFGAIVLIRYSDRPGGTVKWLGMEITSKGAGLPLIALGIGCIALTVTGVTTPERDGPATPAGSSGDPPASAAGALPASAPGALPGCLAPVAAAVPAERVVAVEVGMRDLAIVSPPEPLDLPVALLLTENGAPVGAVRLRLYRGTDSSSHLFKVEEAIGADCEPAALANVSTGGDPRSLPNWNTLRLRLGGVDYHLRLGAEEQLRVGHFSRAS